MPPRSAPRTGLPPAWGQAWENEHYEYYQILIATNSQHSMETNIEREVEELINKIEELVESDINTSSIPLELRKLATASLTRIQHERDKEWCKHLKTVLGSELYNLHDKHFRDFLTTPDHE